MLATGNHQDPEHADPEHGDPEYEEVEDMLMRFDPFREFDRAWRETWGTVRTPAMPMDAYRQGDHLIVHFDLPGVSPDSIELTVEKNVLTVGAERTWSGGEGVEVLVSERPHGSFSRQLFLGEGLDLDRVEASYDAGVLTLRIPVAEAARPRKVAVVAAGNGGAKAIDTASVETSESPQAAPVA